MENAKKRTSAKGKGKKAFINKPKKAFASASNIVSIAEKRNFGVSPANSVIKISRTAYPVPDVLVTKFKTSNVLNATTGASGAINSYRIYANSLYDPTGAVGGTQPRFFDQLTNIYNKFVVYGCKVNIKILRKSTSQDATVRVLGFPCVNATMPLASLYSQGNELPKTIRFDLNTTSANGGNLPLSESKEKSVYFDVGEFFGIDRAKLMSDDKYECTAAGDPTNILSFYIGIQGYEAAFTDDVLMEVSITQYAACRQVAVPAAS